MIQGNWLHITHDSYNRSERLAKLLGCPNLEMFPQRVLVRPVLMGHRLANDYDRRSIRCILFGKSRPCRKRNSQCRRRIPESRLAK